MRFVILIVRTLDWGNIKSFPHSCLESEVGWKKFLNRVDQWNETFNISYFEYRAKLKEIALKSFEKTGIRVRTCPTWHKANQFVKNHIHRDDLIILPTDDDDWYHPDIKSYLKKEFADKNLPMVQWREWKYTIRKKEVFHPHCSDAYVGSNEFAIRCSKTDGQIKSHAMMPTEYLKIEKCLSVWVRHPASLWDNATTSFEFEEPSETSEIPNELEWATEYIKMLRDIRLSKTLP